MVTIGCDKDSTKESICDVLIWFSLLNDRYKGLIRSLAFVVVVVVVELIPVVYFTLSEKADILPCIT